MTKPAFLPDFHGDDIEGDLLEAQLAFGLPKGDLDIARSLFATKWWDYRFIHPGTSFLLFADLYGKAVERWRGKFGVSVYARLSSSGHPLFKAERKGNVETDELTLRPAVTRTGMWRAMCFADAHGVAYDRYIELAFSYAAEHNWQRIPSPAGMYGVAMTEYILRRWNEEQDQLTHLPKDPAFMAANFTGHPYQVEFQAWILNTIARRPNPRYPLAQYIGRERYIVPKLALQKFGQSLMKDVVSLLKR